MTNTTSEKPSTEQVLAATSSEGLLTTYAALTHRISAVQTDRMDPAARREALRTLRAQRDLVAAEILRRMG